MLKLHVSTGMATHIWLHIFLSHHGHVDQDQLAKRMPLHTDSNALLFSPSKQNWNNAEQSTKHKFNQVCWLDWYKPKYANLSMQPHVSPNPKHNVFRMCRSIIVMWHRWKSERQNTDKQVIVHWPTKHWANSLFSHQQKYAYHWWNGPSRPNLNSLYLLPQHHSESDIPFVPTRQNRPSNPYTKSCTHMSLQVQYSWDVLDVHTFHTVAHDFVQILTHPAVLLKLQQCVFTSSKFEL